MAGAVRAKPGGFAIVTDRHVVPYCAKFTCPTPLV